MEAIYLQAQMILFGSNTIHKLNVYTKRGKLLLALTWQPMKILVESTMPMDLLTFIYTDE